MVHIRNFVIIAHIDHGKSTLADRMIELTQTVEARKMRAQYLDRLDLERERGITIKMAPVQMRYRTAGKDYILNLIDTPGHSDFSYEVSRSLMAVEGAVLLVDAMQGIQAQTLANFHAAKAVGLRIIGAVNKIDMNPPYLAQRITDLAELLSCGEEEIVRLSAKTGEGVNELLETITRIVPPPQKQEHTSPRALIFDSHYDEHKGVVAYVRVFDGNIITGMKTQLAVAATSIMVKEVGIFAPDLRTRTSLETGTIGWIATGIKDTEVVKIGDTIGEKALPGYRDPQPVVFVSIYPDPGEQSADADYDTLLSALRRLKLNDSALLFDPDFSPVLGRGFKCGFLGRLHFEITVQRLEREFSLKLVTSFPSVVYRIHKDDEWVLVQNPNDFPDVPPAEVLQPMARLEILVPPEESSAVLKLKDRFRLTDIKVETFANRTLITALLPLSDLIRDFDDRLKSVSGGFASFSYTQVGDTPAEVEKLEILVADEVVPGLTRIVARDDAEREGRHMVERLKDLLPRQQFTQALQARLRGRIIARETIPALKKDVTGYLYGGDRTRKMKLWKKQKEGKKRLKGRGRVSIPADVFKKLLRD